jgi:hypothetical protein
VSREDQRVTGGARATLDAWREQGADRLDPVRFRFIDALERRAVGHRGGARRILDERVAQLLDAYADDLKRAASAVADTGLATSANEPDRATLSSLIDHLACHRAAADTDRRAPYPELELLDYFRTIWSGLSTERQFRQSLEQVPGNAGPLNSSSLVHRSLSLMRELSPGYLQQFLSYVDTLSWMEQIGGSAMLERDAPRTASVRKGARGKAR